MSQHGFLAVLTAMTGATAMIGGAIWERKHEFKEFKADTWLILASLLIGTVATAANIGVFVKKEEESGKNKK